MSPEPPLNFNNGWDNPYLMRALMSCEARADGVRILRDIDESLSIRLKLVAAGKYSGAYANARGQMVLVYSGPQAIKGTVQAQFKLDPATREIQRIDVYPEPVIDVAAIEKSYGKSCETTAGAEPCYWKKDTAQKHPYFLYPKVGLAIFFKEDDKTVLSFAFLPPQA